MSQASVIHLNQVVGAGYTVIDNSSANALFGQAGRGDIMPAPRRF